MPTFKAMGPDKTKPDQDPRTPPEVPVREPGTHKTSAPPMEEPSAPPAHEPERKEPGDDPVTPVIGSSPNTPC